MGKSGDRKTTKTKKDKVQEKFGPGAIVKAKDKRKKVANLKKNKEKLGEEIQSANTEFLKLQSKMITEKENKKADDEKTKKSSVEISVLLPAVSQEKQVEETTNVLACL